MLLHTVFYLLFIRLDAGRGNYLSSLVNPRDSLNITERK